MDFVKLELRAPVAIVTLDRPDCLNALNNYFWIVQDSMTHLTDFVDHLETLEEPVVLFLYGCIHHSAHACRNLSLVIVALDAQTHRVQLAKVSLAAHARNLKRELLFAVQVKQTIERSKLIPACIVGSRHIDFHLEASTSRKRDDRHTCTDSLTCLVQLILHIT